MAAAAHNPWILLAVFPLAAYAIGSTPFGVIIARARGVDLRGRGSGNIGATNVGRVLGRKWGCLCFVLDLLKGLVPVLLVGLYLSRRGGGVPLHSQAAWLQAAWLAAAFGTIAGHVFSFWLKFRGGKGVATSLGVLMGLYPYFTWVGLAALGLWCLVVLIWRYVSLASITAAAAFPLLFVAACWVVDDWKVTRLWPLLAFAAAMAALVVVRHRSNIQRLLAGTENKIGQGKAPAPSETSP